MAQVSRELGIGGLAKLASNECPLPPFPEVVEAAAAAASGVNRYPDNSAHELVDSLARHLDVAPDQIWPGAGSTQLIAATALAVGGPGTSALYADPSFVMYPIATRIAGSEEIVVPLDERHRHDLDAMLAAIDATTTLVYLCNPNNPTGTIVDAGSVDRFVDAVPDDVLIVVDEAYHEYVTDGGHRSAVPHAVTRDNVVVMRTFSKVYGLAGLRIGYAVGRADTLAWLRRTQVPFSANSLAQAAAIEAMRHPDRLAKRIADNAAGREQLEAGLATLGVRYAPSQTNFVAVFPERDPSDLAAALERRGVIVRALGPVLRVTVGTDAENDRFLVALAEELA